MKKTLVAVAMLIAGVVAAGTIKTWSNADVLTASDLNSNFAHIHNLMVGSHGARLVNADVSANAAISTSKLADKLLVPKTWVTLLNANISCSTTNGGACTETTGASASVTGSGDAGTYQVVLGYTATNATYGVSTSIMTDATVTGTCSATTLGTGSFVVRCLNNAGAPTNMGWTAVVYDDD